MSDELYNFEEDYRDYYKQMEKAKKIVEQFPNHKTIFEIDNKEYTLQELYNKGVQLLWSEYFICIIKAKLPSDTDTN